MGAPGSVVCTQRGSANAIHALGVERGGEDGVGSEEVDGLRLQRLVGPHVVVEPGYKREAARDGGRKRAGSTCNAAG